jgi:hypothetical protein
MQEKSVFDDMDEPVKEMKQETKQENTYTGEYNILLVPFKVQGGSQILVTLNAIPRVNEHILINKKSCKVEYRVAQVVHNAVDNTYDVACHVIYVGSY